MLIRTQTLVVFLTIACAASADALADEEAHSVSKAVLNTDARPIDRTAPSYPRRALNRGQEGWVIVSYVVQSDGTVTDPIVVDSSGIAAFEKSALQTVTKWTFEPATQNGKPVEQCHTRAQLTFAIEDETRGARRKFIRRYKNANELIGEGDFDGAESLIDETMELGEWNLYEYGRLWLLKAMVAEGREDKRAQLNALYRTVGKKGEFVEKRIVKAVLPMMLHLELELSEYSAALETYEQLQDFSKFPQKYEYLAGAVDELIATIESENILSVPAKIGQCADCSGKWSYKPLRREFAFDNVNGALKDFELRCDWRRYRHNIDTGLSWKIPEKWGECRLHVYGDVGATFDFMEFAVTEEAESDESVTSNSGYAIDAGRKS